MSEETEHGGERGRDSNAREGLVTLLLSLALWGGLMGLFLGVGHLLANQMAAGH